METKIDQLKKMLEDRDMGILFARVASTLLQKGNVEEAFSICESGIKKFPMYSQGHYVMARCYDQQGKSEQARAEYERTIKYDPNHLSAINRLAELYQAGGMEDKSREKVALLQTLDTFNEQVDELAQSLGMAAEEPEKELPEDPLKVDKVDLSQFDNIDDDFTTIIQGKKQEKVKPEKSDDISLSLGAAAGDLATDTDMNNRIEYEEEVRLRDNAESKDSGKKEE